MSEYNCIKQRVIQCSNCGKKGHNFRYCRYPITSYGVVNISVKEDVGTEKLFLKKNFSQINDIKYQIVSRKYPDIKYLFSNKINFHKNNQLFRLDPDGVPFTDEEKLSKFVYYKDRIVFMMVSRRYSLGFSDFIRGKYNIHSASSIIHLFEQMYEKEIELVSKKSYDDLLYMFLNRSNESRSDFLNKIYEGRYSIEYCEAKTKHDMLMNSDQVPFNLNFYTKYIKPKWKTPEWGFPKGKRNQKSEQDLTCACREFEEETGYKIDEYHVLNKVEPIEEYLIGTNGVSYRHVYYLSVDNIDTPVGYGNSDSLEKTEDDQRDYDRHEIGEIKWLTFNEAIEAIRPYHTNKKKILTNIYLFILNALISNVTV